MTQLKSSTIPPPPGPERKGEAENQTEEANRIARDQAAIRQTTEINVERRQKGQKSAQMFSITRRTKGSNLDYFFFGTGRQEKVPTKPCTGSYRNDQPPQFLQSLRDTFQKKKKLHNLKKKSLQHNNLIAKVWRLSF